MTLMHWNRSVLRRLAEMSWDEFATRGSQELAKRWDAALHGLGMAPAATRLRNLPSERFGQEEARRGRFFFTADELPQIAALLRQRFPAEVSAKVAEAERICRHRFDLLGYRDLDYGPEVDWHLDAVHRKRAPCKPWFRIRYLDFDEVGDHKVVWELNRHQHLVTLAAAYILTGNEQFVKELLSQWYHWQQKNPYPIGINWASSLEVAFRSLSWLWVRHLLDACPLVGESVRLDLRRQLALHARHIETYLSTYFSPNTHVLGEGVALFFIGTLLPELPEAERRQQQGWEIVVREAGRQVRADGFHFDHSVYYHVYALDFFLHARTLAVRNQVAIPPAFDQVLVKMLEILRALAQGGSPLRLGDDDGGRVFNPRRNRSEHMRDPLATGAVVFERADFKAAARDLCEETLWLMGPEGVARFNRLAEPGSDRCKTQASTGELSSASAVFEASGIYVMTDSARVRGRAVVNAGWSGTKSGGHGHADLLSIQISSNGHEWLVDPGTFAYVGRERESLRRTASHNTLQVDGQSQAEPAGPFAWRSPPGIKVEQWAPGTTFNLFAGSHTGYCRLPSPVVHQRWVFQLNSRFWLVRDVATGEGPHNLDLFWHLAPGLKPSDAGPNATLVPAEGQYGLALITVEGHGWAQETLEDIVSPAYGVGTAGPVVCFSKQSVLPVEFVTLLLPLAPRGAPLGKDLGVLTEIDKGVGNVSSRGYRYNGGGERHLAFFAARPERWHLGPWSSDAQFVYCGIAPGDGSQHGVLCGGSYVEVGGERLLTCQRAVISCEWLSDRTGTRVFCSDGSAPGVVSEAALVSAAKACLGER